MDGINCTQLISVITYIVLSFPATCLHRQARTRVAGMVCGSTAGLDHEKRDAADSCFDLFPGLSSLPAAERVQHGDSVSVCVRASAAHTTPEQASRPAVPETPRRHLYTRAVFPFWKEK